MIEFQEFSSIYCMFLNTGGRILFDSIISPGFEPNEFFLEVDQTMSKNVVKHLSMYRGMINNYIYLKRGKHNFLLLVRRKIQIEPVPELKVYSVFHEDLKFSTNSNLQTRSRHLGSTFCDGGTSGDIYYYLVPPPPPPVRN